MKNENGFSLIELAVAAAIMSILMITAANQFSGVAEGIKQQQEELQQQQANQQAELEFFLDSVN